MTVKVRVVNGKVRLDIDYKGVRRYRTIGPDTKANRDEAERQKEKLETGLRYLGEAALKGPEKVKTVRFKDYAERWLKELKRTDLKEATIQCYESNLKHHLIPAFGAFELKAITYEAVKTFLQTKRSQTYLVQRKKQLDEGEAPTYREYSRDSVRLMRATLRAVLEEAYTEGKIPMNPAASRKHARIYLSDKRHENAYPKAEIQKLEQGFKVKYPDFYPFVLVMSRAGLRIGEAMGLEWGDLDFAGFKIRVSKNKSAGRKLSTPKTKGSNRLVDMSDELVEALREFRARRAAKWLKNGSDLPDVVFCREDGKYLDYSNFMKAWKRVHKTVKLIQRRPHDLRHTFASRLLMERETVLYVSAQLGDNPATVLKTYAHYIPADSSSRGVNKLNDSYCGESEADDNIEDAKRKGSGL